MITFLAPAFKWSPAFSAAVNVGANIYYSGNVELFSDKPLFRHSGKNCQSFRTR